MPCSSGRLGVGLPGRAPFRGRLRVSSHSWSPSPLARRAGPGLGGTAARALTRLLSRTCFGHDPFRRGQPCPESCIPAGAPGVAEARCHRPLCPVRRWRGQRHAHFLAVQLGDRCSRFRSRRECARWPQALRSSSSDQATDQATTPQKGAGSNHGAGCRKWYGGTHQGVN